MIRILMVLVVLYSGPVQAEVKIKTLTSPSGIAAWKMHLLQTVC